MEQLVLGLPRPKEQTFDDFFCAGHHSELLHTLQHLDQHVSDKGLYLQGDSGAGKTHLLRALSYQWLAMGRRVVYVAGRSPHSLLSDHLLQDDSLIVVDDVDELMQHSEWQMQLYQAYNELTPRSFMVLSSRLGLEQYTSVLPDWLSRMQSLARYSVLGLSDAEKQQWLSWHVSRRGMVMPEAVGRYVLTHCSRSMADLVVVLRQLEHASLVHQRALTVPFVRNILQLA